MQRLSILFLLFLLEFCVGQQRIQCKGLGQYCTLHSDCCSNSCLSFSYKCVEYHGDHNDEPSMAHNIDEIVEKFNSDSTTNTYQTVSNEMPSTLLSMETNRPESTTDEMDRNIPVCRANGFSCSNSNQCCTLFCSKITNMCIEPTENSLSTEQLIKPEGSRTPPSCGGIGYHCYSEAECCAPFHCHGYLHQCVT